MCAKKKKSRYQWLLRRQRSGGLRLEISLGKQFMKPYLEKTHHKRGLVEWLKV
jgi:hypothetical protein